MAPAPGFLPATPEELCARGWEAPDILLVTGDAYVDHPSFGTALLGRLLESKGYRVAICAQPRWEGPEELLRFGRPRLFCGVTAGALDSMLAHYTAFRKKRSDDAYTPGGRSGARPNRASLVYASLVRQAFPGLPVLLGGIEASLRRAAHYDFWTDAVRRSLLLDAKADLLLYGMAERSVLWAAERLSQGEPLAGIPGSVWSVRAEEIDPAWELLPSHETILAQPRALLDATLAIERQVHHAAPTLVQLHGPRAVVFAPPPEPLSTEELDELYALPFLRAAHPSYAEAVPAAGMVEHSLTAVRGCGGGCSFCSLALHQGRRVQSRSADSLADELRRMTTLPGWRGSVSDVGGPTANAYASSCALRDTPGSFRCARPSCYAPEPCPHLRLRQGEYLALLRRLAALPGVKHLRVASGLRHDIALSEPEAAAQLAGSFTGGQLKLAPEHMVPHVLARMRKSGFDRFERFLALFARASEETAREQYIIPYLMSAFPGCTREDMKALSAWLRARGWTPRQVQCFIPLPGTVAAALYHAGCDEEGNPLYVAKSDRERLEQHYELTGESAPPARSARAGKQRKKRR